MTSLANPPQIKINLPEFHGKSIEEWLQFVGAMRVEFLRNPTAYPDEGAKSGLAMSLFRGDAMLWLNTLTDTQLGSYMGSYTVFTSAVRAQWGMPDAQLIVKGRSEFGALKYNKKNPEEFFATASIQFNLQGVHTGVSRCQAVWPKLPQKVKDTLVNRDLLNPSWDELRSIAIQVSLMEPDQTPATKPKCKTCGKRHHGACRSKN